MALWPCVVYHDRTQHWIMIDKLIQNIYNCIIMQRVILQVPMNKDLKEKAQIASADLGFSSLQETIRVLLTKLSRKELSLRVTEEAEEITHLSKTAERRFKKAVEDIKAGRNITKTKNVDDFLSLLRS